MALETLLGQQGDEEMAHWRNNSHAQKLGSGGQGTPSQRAPSPQPGISVCSLGPAQGRGVSQSRWEISVGEQFQVVNTQEEEVVVHSSHTH